MSALTQAWFDGSCADDGRVSYGFIVAQDHRVVFSGSGFHGELQPGPDSQIAEIAGLIAALRWLAAHRITRATVYGDCAPMIDEVLGRCRRVRPRHRVYVDEARVLLAQLPRVRLVWIPRSVNTNANTLATVARENYTTLDRWGSATNDRRTRARRPKPTGARRRARQILTWICQRI